MNKAQLDYALTRVDTMLNEKVARITAANTKPAQIITDAQRAELVRTGKVKIRADITSISHYDDVVKVFDFSKYSWTDTGDAKTIARLAKPFREQAQKLKDKIMLGDESTAMAALESFAAKCSRSAAEE